MFKSCTLRRFFFLFIIILLTQMACRSLFVVQPTPVAPTPTVTYSTYANSQFGFDVDTPSSWAVGNPRDGVIEFRSEPSVTLDINYSGGSAVQVVTIPNLLIGDDDPTTQLELFQSQITERTQLEDASTKVIEPPRPISAGPYPAARTEITARQGTVDVFSQVWLLQGEERTAYVITIFPQAESATYRPLIVHMVESLRLAPLSTTDIAALPESVRPTPTLRNTPLPAPTSSSEQAPTPVPVATQPPTPTQSMLPFPVPSNSTHVKFEGPLDISLTFESELSAKSIAAFYRLYADREGLTERELLTVVSDNVVNLVFEGYANGQTLIVQAIPIGENRYSVTIRIDEL